MSIDTLLVSRLLSSCDSSMMVLLPRTIAWLEQQPALARGHVRRYVSGPTTCVLSPPMTRHSQHGTVRDRRIAARVKRRRAGDPRQIDCQISFFLAQKRAAAWGGRSGRMHG